MHSITLNILIYLICINKKLGERELVEFLTEEIVAERKAQKIKTIPTDFEGFKVTLNGADVELVKQTDKEK